MQGTGEDGNGPRFETFCRPWLVARSTRHSDVHRRQDDVHTGYGWGRTTLKLALFSLETCLDCFRAGIAGLQ